MRASKATAMKTVKTRGGTLNQSWGVTFYNCPRKSFLKSVVLILFLFKNKQTKTFHVDFLETSIYILIMLTSCKVG